MKVCKKLKDKILFFDDLTEEEKLQVETHLAVCENCSRYQQKIRQFLHNVKQLNDESHIEDEQIARYVSFQGFPGEADYNGETLASKEVRRIKNHLDSCLVCQEKYQVMSAELAGLRDFVMESDLPEMTIGKESRVKNVKDKLTEIVHSFSGLAKKVINRPRLQLIPAAVLAAIIVFMVVRSPYFQSEENTISKLAKMNKREFGMITRGGASGLFPQALKSIQKEEYVKAVNQLNTFLTGHPEKERQAYANLLLGYSQLMGIQSKSLTDLSIEEKNKINIAIQHLKSAIYLTNNVRIKEDGYWFNAKANLMEGEVDAASQNLEKIIALNGRKSAEARAMLASLREKTDQRN